MSCREHDQIRIHVYYNWWRDSCLTVVASNMVGCWGLFQQSTSSTLLCIFEIKVAVIHCATEGFYFGGVLSAELESWPESWWKVLDNWFFTLKHSIIITRLHILIIWRWPPFQVLITLITCSCSVFFTTKTQQGRPILLPWVMFR